MTFWTRSLRGLFFVALSIYLGGFTFYSLAVIPVLHDRLESSFEAGLVTQRVTDLLNLLGVATLSLGWWACGVGAIGGHPRARSRRRIVYVLLISSVCLVVLLMLHRVLDRKLETGALAGFYLVHRAYLWASTVQWVANLALLIQSANAVTPTRESHP